MDGLKSQLPASVAGIAVSRPVSRRGPRGDRAYQGVTVGAFGVNVFLRPSNPGTAFRARSSAEAGGLQERAGDDLIADLVGVLVGPAGRGGARPGPLAEQDDVARGRALLGEVRQ